MTIWRCSACPATLGEIDGDRVIIRIKRREIIAAPPVEQTCWSCGVRNVYPPAPALDDRAGAALSSAEHGVGHAVTPRSLEA